MGVCVAPCLGFPIYKEELTHAGLLLRLNMGGYLQKLLGGRERIKHDYLALAKSALGPHGCKEE